MPASAPGWISSSSARPRSLAVARGTHVTFIADAFNVLNRQNYSGYVGAQKDATGQLRPDFGSPNGTFATRQFQFGSRLQF